MDNRQKIKDERQKIGSSEGKSFVFRLSSFVWKTIGTGFGSGYSPFAPGTAGALVGCGILAALHFFAPGEFYWPGLATLIVAFFFLGAIATDKLEPQWGHDPSRIVADEMIGVWIAMLGVPFSWLNLAIAFGLFRLFDIWKPLGIRRMEKLPGGWGVMMDDVLAGIYSLIVIHLFLYFQN